MNNKIKYISPEAEIEILDNTEVVLTSDLNGNEEDPFKDINRLPSSPDIWRA